MEQRIVNRYPVRCLRCGTELTYGREVYYDRFAARSRKIRCFPACADGTGTQPLPVPEATEQPQVNTDSLAAAIAQAVQPLIKTTLDAGQIENLIEDRVNAKIPGLIGELKASLTQTVTVEVRKPNGETHNAGIQHRLFPTLLTMMQATGHTGHRLNIWIAGPAGTGKTQAVESAAKALGLEYASTGSLTESYKVFGFIVPGTGTYSPTPFRHVWENGGGFLFDDCDGSDPSVLVEFNNALANGSCTFPDGNVKRHPDCLLVLTANTWGYGATNDYVGRMKQDAAFLDRFVRLFWDIDEDLERATCPNSKWVSRVQAVRANVKAKGIKVLVTPRASYYGAALLQAGLSWEETETAILRAAMTQEQWASVKAGN